MWLATHVGIQLGEKVPLAPPESTQTFEYRFRRQHQIGPYFVD
jgi:hypothetical protein